MHLIPQSWSHWHILISVFPSFGLVCVLGVYIAGLVKGDITTRRTCLVLFVLLALLSVPVYLSGAGSMAELRGNPRFSRDMLMTHYDWGTASLVALVTTGVAALVALALTGRKGRLSADALPVVLGLAVVTLLLLVVADGAEVAAPLDPPVAVLPRRDLAQPQLLLRHLPRPPWGPEGHRMIMLP